MKQPFTISLELASFDKLTMPGKADTTNCTGLLFFGVGADTRAAVTPSTSQQAFKFLLLGMHENETSANNFIDNNAT